MCPRIVITVFFLLYSQTALAQALKDKLIDPTDHHFDVSGLLASRAGFFPIPIVITEPAVGIGGGAALLYFWPPKIEEKKAETDRTANTSTAKPSKTIPPSISGLGGAYTSNRTWLVGGFHFGSWLKDSLRYLGIAGYGDVNMKFYGNSRTEKDLLGDGVAFNAKGIFTRHEMSARIFGSDFFIGLDYQFSISKIAFEHALPEEIDIPDHRDFRDSGLGGNISYDGRDNIFTPTKGAAAGFGVMAFNEALGGLNNFVLFTVDGTAYWPVLQKVVWAFRLDLQFTQGEAPFYQKPFLKMRGFPALRYQGNHAALFETEIRWNFFRRWSVLGFYGCGNAEDALADLFTQGVYLSGGGGFRYLLARKLGIQAGIDVAKSTADWATYIVFGSAWL